jgi:8-oxo-dGTP pyrophosphatase MutT (NUDIX family)
MRAYVIPVFCWSTPDRGDLWGVVINRKRLMPVHGLAWEGKAHFIGGKVEEGESLPEAVLREAREEVGWAVEAAALVPLPHTDRYAFFAVYLPGAPQELYRGLAGACTEGTVDLVLESSIPSERWAGPELSTAAEQAIAVIKQQKHL